MTRPIWLCLYGALAFMCLFAWDRASLRPNALAPPPAAVTRPMPLGEFVPSTTAGSAIAVAAVQRRQLPSSDDTQALLVELENALASPDLVIQDDAVTRLLPALIARHAPATARLAELQSSPALREQLLRQVALLWAARDGRAAITWAETLEPVERDAALTDIAAQMALAEPAQAVELRARQAPPTETDPALENLVQQWAVRDFDASLAWVEAR